MRIMGRLGILLLALPVLAVVNPAHAATAYTWTGNGTTSAWTDPQNWGGGGYPQDGDSAVLPTLPSKSTYVVLNSTVILQSLTISETSTSHSTNLVGSGSVTVTGSLSWNGGDIETSLTLGAGAVGTMSNQIKNSDLIQFGAHDSTAQVFTVNGALTMNDLGGMYASLMPAGYGYDYSPNGGLLLRDDIVLNATGSINLVGQNEFWSDCCTAPAGLVNNGSTVTVDGTWLSQARYDTTGTTTTTNTYDMAILQWPTYAGSATWNGPGTVCVCGNGDVTWSNNEIRGGFVMSGNQTLGSGTTMLIDANADMGGIGNIVGSGRLRLGTSDWKAKSTVGGTVDFSTLGGATARISSYDNTHVGVIGQLTLGTGGNVMAYSLLVVGPDGSLTIPKGKTLTMPNGSWLSASGCCTGGANVVVNGTLSVGGNSGQRLGDTDAASDPAYLQNVDLGGTGTVTFAGTTEWDVDDNHHFAGTMKGRGTVIGDLPIGRATFAPSGAVTVTDDFSAVKGATVVIKISGPAARPKVATPIKVKDSADLAGTLKVTGIRAKKNKVVAPITFAHNVYSTRFSRITGPWTASYTSKSVKLKAR